MTIIAAADVGHPDLGDRGSHFGGWLTSDAKARRLRGTPYEHPESFGRAVGTAMREDPEALAVLALEAPRSATVGPYGVPRPGEAALGKPWYKGNGATVFVLCSSQGPFLLEALHAAVGGHVTATVDPRRWGSAARLLLVEGFAVGGTKLPVQEGWQHDAHTWDAATIAAAIAAQGRAVHSTVGDAHGSIPVKNEWVADAIWAGLDIDIEEIRLPCVMIRPVPALPVSGAE